MNKLIRKSKPISNNVLEISMYYSKFNLLYILSFFIIPKNTVYHRVSALISQILHLINSCYGRIILAPTFTSARALRTARIRYFRLCISISENQFV